MKIGDGCLIFSDNDSKWNNYLQCEYAMNIYEHSMDWI